MSPITKTNRECMIERYENIRRRQHWRRGWGVPYQQQWEFCEWVRGFRKFMQPKEETHGVRQTQLDVQR